MSKCKHKQCWKGKRCLVMAQRSEEGRAKEAGGEGGQHARSVAAPTHQQVFHHPFYGRSVPVPPEILRRLGYPSGPPQPQYFPPQPQYYHVAPRPQQPVNVTKKADEAEVASQVGSSGYDADESTIGWTGSTTDSGLPVTDSGLPVRMVQDTLSSIADYSYGDVPVSTTVRSAKATYWDARRHLGEIILSDGTHRPIVFDHIIREGAIRCLVEGEEVTYGGGRVFLRQEAMTGNFIALPAVEEEISFDLDPEEELEEGEGEGEGEGEA